MQVDIKYNPSYALALVTLNMGEKIKAEGGAMVSMSSNIQIETHKAVKKNGLLKSLKSSIFGRESFWMNTFTAQTGSGEVTLAPTLPGDISSLSLNGTMFVQASSFLAGPDDLDIDTSFQGMKGFFSGESLFFLKLSGKGDLLMSSYGGIEVVEVDGSIIVDTGHIVAFEEGLTYKIKKFGGWKSFLFSGEGLIMEFSGKGKIWIQSRNVTSLSGWLSKVLPPRSS
ncbi:MAG: TIGR00266 family protein [Spirochaetes bacterium]|nr:TIGR00266 family protein [Spirochaetota bacterium]